MLKGLGVSTIMKLTIGLLVASLFISTATIGSLGDAIRTGISDIGDVTDFTTDVKNKDTLSDLTMFVQHRAVNEGCDLVDNINEGNMNSDELDSDAYPGNSINLDGYEHLEGTRLTQYPDCFGGEASVIRDQLNWLPGRGTFGGGPDENYMPGIYSRELFRINGEILIDTSESSTWLDNRVGVAESERTLSELGEIQRNSNDDGISALEAASIIIAPGAYATYTLYDAWANGDDTEVTRVFIVFEASGDASNRTAEEGDIIKAQLCPGDEGYVQANREYIDNERFTSEEPLYPVIVITDLGKNCGDVNVDRTDKAPDNLKPSGRLLHITGDTSKGHPFVRGPGAGGSRKNYAFDLHNLNEEDNSVEQGIYSAAANGISFYHNSQKADKCVIGMWDHRSSGVDSTGWITFNQGTHIDYDGEFPERYSSNVDEDNLGDRTDRPVPPYPSTRNLYDDYASEGFSDKTWEKNGLNDKLLYDFGSRKFELYGDLLCGEHDENDDFNDYHSKWYMCRTPGKSVTADGEQWTCQTNGKWTN